PSTSAGTTGAASASGRSRGGSTWTGCRRRKVGQGGGRRLADPSCRGSAEVVDGAVRARRELQAGGSEAAPRAGRPRRPRERLVLGLAGARRGFPPRVSADERVAPRLTPTGP